MYALILMDDYLSLSNTLLTSSNALLIIITPMSVAAKYLEDITLSFGEVTRKCNLESY